MQVALQLGLALLMAALCALVHAGGLLGVSRLFNLEDKELERKSLSLSTVWMVPTLALALFLLHFAEIALFAALYLLVGAAPMPEALYCSVSSYTTAGNGIEALGRDWRILGGAEALAGFLLIGWSTAYLVAKLRKLGE